MAVVELRETVNVIVSQVKRGRSGINGVNSVYKLIDELTGLADGIDEGIQTFGKITHSVTGKEVYAYEVSCLRVLSLHRRIFNAINNTNSHPTPIRLAPLVARSTATGITYSWTTQTSRDYSACRTLAT